MGNTNKTFGERMMEKVPRYGNYGGPDYSGGEWVKDSNAEIGYRWNQRAEPIDGQDELYRQHDMAYGLAEIKYENGEISFQEQSIMKTKADIQLLNALRQYDPYADPECLGKEFGQMYQILAITAFTEKILWDNTYGIEVNPILDKISNLITSSASLGNAFMGSPIILDLDRDGVETLGVKDGAFFDHDGNGFAERTGWTSSHDGLLVMNRNEDSIINDGKELFGDETLLASGQKATNGFQALAELDSNHDGKIDVSDAAYSQLKVWQDIDGDGYSSADELKTLVELGIQSVNTGYTNSTVVDADGNEHRQVGAFTWNDDTTGAAEDVWFKMDKMYTVAGEWLDVPEDIAALPDLMGFGNVYDLHQAMVRDTTGQLQALVEQFIAATDATVSTNLMDQILYKWTDSDGIDPNSRGFDLWYSHEATVDARQAATLEKFVGEGFYSQVGTGSQANYLAGDLLKAAYHKLSEMFYGQLMARRI